ncbi:MAG: hypothetical protein HC906_15815 [Bacteroidales bacterium]|nr:hypothetical protein [Bacteroidales bacterium]
MKISLGPLKGLQGIVTFSNNKNRMIIRLDVVNVNYIVDIHPALVQPVDYPV